MRIAETLGAGAAALFLGACLQIGTTASDAGAGPGNAHDAASAAGDAGDASTSGSGCVVDPASGVTLCTRIATCPDLAVDHDVYPDCGFRVPSASLDVECLCGNFLCPLGAAHTCAQAEALLASQSEIAACTQASEGRCAATEPPVPPNGSCDKVCQANCAGDPGCYRLCGC